MIAYVAALWQVLTHALGLDPAALDLLIPDRGYWSIPMGILVLSVIGMLSGQAAVLAINRVRRFRLVFTLVSSIAGTALTYATIGALLWGMGLALGISPRFDDVVQSVFVASAPFIFGVLVALPYSGPAVQRGLQLWSFGILWALVMHQFGTERWTSLLITAVGTLGGLAVSHVLGRPLAWVRDRLWLLMTGERLMLTSQEIMDSFPLMGDEDLSTGRRDS